MQPNPILILQTSAVILAISAVGGATMAGMRFSGRAYPPTWLAMLHGFLSAAALTSLVFAWCTLGLPTLAAAAGVTFVVGRTRRRRDEPELPLEAIAAAEVARAGTRGNRRERIFAAARGCVRTLTHRSSFSSASAAGCRQTGQGRWIPASAGMTSKEETSGLTVSAN